MDLNQKLKNNMNWGYGILIGVGVLTGLYGLWCGFSFYTRASVQKLSYHLVAQVQSKKYSKKIQIRQYPPFLIAEATYPRTQMKAAMKNGFQDIAGFIFGKNVARDKNQSEKIAMTAPVAIKKQQTDGYTISFVMPSKYKKQTLPIPKNDKVIIKQVGSKKMGCLSWRGNVPSPDLVEEKQKQLRNILAQFGYQAKGKSYLFEYDPPFTPGWMRINEILLQVQEDK